MKECITHVPTEVPLALNAVVFTGRGMPSSPSHAGGSASANARCSSRPRWATW
jgi:hypothetical protein